jgi:hypothetical protein
MLLYRPISSLPDPKFLAYAWVAVYLDTLVESIKVDPA